MADEIGERSSGLPRSYASVLDRAHRSGLRRIVTALLQAPDEVNGLVAIVTAQVETDRGLFEAIGDANPRNVPGSATAHLIRMAELRAKMRALCDALNVTESLAEDAGSDATAHTDLMEEGLPDGGASHQPSPAPPSPAQRPSANVDEIGKGVVGAQHNDDVPRATPQQLATISRLSQLLKLDAPTMTNMSTVEATACIAELAQSFNGRRRRDAGS